MKAYSKKQHRSERYCFFVIGALFAAMLVLRAVSSGFGYDPILDDSIQYISYPSSADPMALILQEGLFSSRPLAAVTDLFVIGKMPGLLLPILLLSVLHAAGGVLFLRLFRRRFDTGLLFCVLYALLPLGVEGTYWLSASSRIVPGLFFTAAAANLFDDYVRCGKKAALILFFPTVLLSYGFYEQILVLSFTLTVLQFLSEIRREKRAWAALSVIPALAVYFAFTAYFRSGGALAERMELVPLSPWYFKVFLPDLIRQIACVFVKGGAMTLFRGFVRGCAVCFRGAGGILVFLLSLLLSAAFVFVIPHGRKKTPAPAGVSVWIWGILLFLAPIAPFFILNNPWFSYRSAVPSFVGAGLVADALLRCLIRKERARAVLCSVLVFLCLIAGISEVHDYRTVGQYDDALAEVLLAKEDEMRGRVGILCLEPYPTETNRAYHEHIESAASSDWALYGKLTAYAGRELSFTPVPLARGDFSFYHGWNTESKRISGFDAIWLWEDGTLSPLSAVRDGETENDFTFYREDGTAWGRVFEEEDYGYLEIFTE